MTPKRDEDQYTIAHAIANLVHANQSLNDTLDYLEGAHEALQDCRSDKLRVGMCDCIMDILTVLRDVRQVLDVTQATTLNFWADPQEVLPLEVP